MMEIMFKCELHRMNLLHINHQFRRLFIHLLTHHTPHHTSTHRPMAPPINGNSHGATRTLHIILDIICTINILISQ